MSDIICGWDGAKIKRRIPTKRERIARMSGALSGTRDQLRALKQNAVDIAARCGLILEENGQVELLTKAQVLQIQELKERFTSAFDNIHEQDKLIDEINLTFGQRTE